MELNSGLTFTGGFTFTFPPPTIPVDYLIVAGGGGSPSGGGGGGGLVYSSSSLGRTVEQSYTITVGGVGSNSAAFGATANAGGLVEVRPASPVVVVVVAEQPLPSAGPVAVIQFPEHR